jgi:hypothetical protein
MKMKTVEFTCMCGLVATASYSEDSDDLGVSVTHELPTCKRFDGITNADEGADYIRDCRLAAKSRLN